MKNNYKKERIIIFILLVVTISLTSVGYAASSVMMKIDAEMLIKAYEEDAPTGEESLLYISGHTVDPDRNSVNNIDYDATVLSSGNVNLTTTIEGGLSYRSKLIISYTVVNESDDYYTYTGATINKTIVNYQNEEQRMDYPCILGVNEGTVIEPHSTKEVQIIYFEDEAEEYDGTYNFNSSVLLSFEKGVKEMVPPKVYTQLLTTEATFSAHGTTDISVRMTNQHSCGYAIMFISDDENISIAFETGNDSNFILIDKDYDEVVPFIIYTSREYTEDVIFNVVILEGYGDYVVRREVGEVTIHPYDGGSTEPEPTPIENIVGTAEFISGSWAEHSTMNVNINNNSGYDIQDWTLKVYFDPDYDLVSIVNYQYVHVLDAINGIITIQSTGLYVGQATPIPNGTSLNVQNTVIEYLKGEYDENNNKVSAPLECIRMILYVKIDDVWYYNIPIG